MFAGWFPAHPWTEETSYPEAPPSGEDVRTTLTGDWGGMRSRLAASGLVVTLDATYTIQGVVAGGLHGPFFHQLSDEGDIGNTLSSELALGLDTAKAGLWDGGAFAVKVEGRAGRSVLQRAGTASAVDTDALYPNVVDRFDEPTTAITTATFTQRVADGLAVFGGLLNTAEGDANDLAGSTVDHGRFLNSALLYSQVEDATVPNVTLGGGITYERHPNVTGSFSVFGSSETAGENPFDQWHGTTFATEWTLRHALAERAGAQTFGALYGVGARRTDIATDPRNLIDEVLHGRPVPTTSADSWALYYNAYQLLQGDGAHGWGVFVRLGVSDGNPNPVAWNAAGGVGGTGLLPARSEDGWGIGTFYVGISHADLLKNLGVNDELGGEVFYNVAIRPWLHVTLDVQVIDSALPRADTACVLGLRTHVDL
jgi:porin